MYNYRDNSIAYVLFDAGYDVWSLSARGTTFSRGHKTLSDQSEDYWQFSLSQIGRYDIPAAIDFILNGNSAHSSVFTVAHSMGTSSIQALLTSCTEWNFDCGKVRGVVMLAPAMYVDGCQSMMLESLLKQPEAMLLKEAKTLFGTTSFLAHEGAVDELPILCYNQPDLCLNTLNWIAGTNPDPTSMDKNRIYVYMNFYPAGSSVQSVNHLIEIAKRVEFADYDFGLEGNLKHYGSAEYRRYKAEKFPKSIPLYVIYGGHDAIVVPEDAEKYISDMESANINDLRQKRIENYTHGDFNFGMKGREDFINDILDFFADYN